jgi:hypothetical protein
MPSYESSVRNLLKAVSSPNWHRPRPWRSDKEAEMITLALSAPECRRLLKKCISGDDPRSFECDSWINFC